MSSVVSNMFRRSAADGKVKESVTTGPTSRRAVLGDISNKSKTNVKKGASANAAEKAAGKPLTKSSSFSGRQDRPVKVEEASSLDALVALVTKLALGKSELLSQISLLKESAERELSEQKAQRRRAEDRAASLESALEKEIESRSQAEESLEKAKKKITLQQQQLTGLNASTRTDPDLSREMQWDGQPDDEEDDKENQAPEKLESVVEEEVDDGREKTEEELDALADARERDGVLPDDGFDWNGMPVIPDSFQVPLAPFITEILEDGSADDRVGLENDMKLYRTKEEDFAPKPYMHVQKDVNSAMREVLIDWLTEVHARYELRSETLFLTINLLDRFLQRRHVPRLKLQLLGCASLLIGCKYEEIYPPRVKDLADLTTGAYTPEQVRSMEGIILSSLDYDVTVPTALQPAARLLARTHSDAVVEQLTRFLLESSLQKYEFVHYKPTLLATAAVFLARKSLAELTEQELFAWSADQIDEVWPVEVAESSQTETNSIEFAQAVLELAARGADTKCSYGAVRRKYEEEKFLSVAKIPIWQPQSTLDVTRAVLPPRTTTTTTTTTSSSGGEGMEVERKSMSCTLSPLSPSAMRCAAMGGVSLSDLARDVRTRLNVEAETDEDGDREMVESEKETPIEF